MSRSCVVRFWTVRRVAFLLLTLASLNGVLLNADDVTLAWDASDDEAVTGYRVYYGPDTGQYTAHIDAGDVTTATVPSLDPGATYFFAATAYTADGTESGFSNEVTHTLAGEPDPIPDPDPTPDPDVNPDSNPPVTPLGTLAAGALDESDLSVSLAWDPSADEAVTGYNLYYGSASGVYDAALDVGMAVTATVGPLDLGATYYFAVTAYTADGTESGYSNEVVYNAPTNVPPLIEVISVQTATEGQSMILTVQATDTTGLGQSFTYRLGPDAPAGAELNPLTGEFRWVPGETHGGGDHPVTIIVEDNGTPSMSAEMTFTVGVLEHNASPVLSAIGNASVVEGQNLTLEFDGFDLDQPAQAIHYGLSGPVPAGATLDPVRGLFSWTPSEAQGPGVYTITAVLEDDGSPAATDEKTFQVTVLEANSAPRIAPLSRRSVAQDAALAVTIEAGDADVPQQNLRFFLGADAPEGVALDAVSGLLTWTPTQQQAPGPYTIPVLVEDDGQPILFGEAVLTVDVEETNLTPTLAAIADQTIEEGALLNLTARGTDADVPAQTLSYGLTPAAPAGAAIDPVTGQFSWTPTETQGPGTFPITVTVDDGTGGNAETTFSVSVTEANAAPVLAALERRTVNEGETLSMRVTASDADVPAQTLRYALETGAPAGAVIDPATGQLTWTPTEVHGPATHNLSVSVTDDGTPALSARQTLVVEVLEANEQPVLAGVSNQTVQEGKTIALTMTATDADVPAQTLRYSLGAGAPVGAVVNATTGAFSWTPTEAQGPGVFPIRVAVEDGVGGRGEQSFQVTVEEVNTAPVLAALTARTVDEGVALGVDVRATDADVPAQSIRYYLGADAPTGAAVDGATGRLTWTPGEQHGPGTHTIRVFAEDNGTPVKRAETVLSVEVKEANQAPVLAAIGSQSIEESRTLRVALSATDTDLPEQTLTFSLGAGAPIGMTIDAANGVITWTPTEAQGPGAYNVDVAVIDHAGGRSETGFDVSVTEANSAPQLAAIAPQSIPETELLTVPVAGSDSDIPAQTLRYELGADAPSGVAIDPVSGVLTWTPTADQGPATYTITVAAVDDGTPPMRTETAFVVDVDEVNTDPVTGPVPDQVIAEGELLEFVVEASDGDNTNQSLTFALMTGAPDGVTVDAETGTFRWTPGEAQGPGVYPVSVEVDDGAGGRTQTDFTVEVLESNTAPDLAAPALTSVNEGQTAAVTLSATDADLPAQRLRFSLDAGAPAGAAVDAVTGRFTWTPGEAHGPGTHSIVVIVEDDGEPAMRHSAVVEVRVNETNANPILETVSSQSVREGKELRLAFTARDTDLPAQPLVFGLGANAVAGMSVVPETGVFSWIPTEEQGPGNFSITAIVQDDAGGRAEQTFSIQVTESNRAPAIAAPPRRKVKQGEAWTATAEASDSDVPSQTLRFTLGDAAPDGIVLNGTTGQLTWTPGQDVAAGAYEFVVTVEDDGEPAMRAETTVVVDVEELNLAPTIAALADQTVDEGRVLQFAVQAADGDVPAQTLTFELGSDAPAGAAIDPVTGVFSWTPGEAQGPDAYPVRVVVSDTAGGEAEAGFTVTVTEVNEAPVMSAVERQILDEGAPFSLTMNAADSDVPVQTLRYTLGAGAPEGMTLDAATGELRWIPAESQGPGSYTVEVSVTDDGTPALSARQTVHLEVREANQDPVLAAVPRQTVTESNTLSLTLTATDGDAPKQTLGYALGAGAPTGATVDAASGLFRWTPTEAQGPGTFPISVTVSDGAGGRAQVDFDVVVLEENAAPVLAAVDRRVVDEGTVLRVGVTASDADVPAQKLRYSLGSNVPAGATLDSATGAFSWTPSEAQGPGEYDIRILVEDDGTPVGRSETVLSVEVREANADPVLASVNARQVEEGKALRVAFSASDADVPAQPLAFALSSGAPLGVSIDRTEGIVNWTPTEAQGPGTYSIGVVVTDDDGGRAETGFTVTVTESNSAPVLTAVESQVVKEGSLLSLLVSGRDSDLPAQSLAYSLRSDAPEGMRIDSRTGLLTWTPETHQGPGTYTVVVVAEDSGTPTMSAETAFVVDVEEVNTDPVTGSLPDQVVREGDLLQFVVDASDADNTGQTLSFTLIDGAAPEGATIDPDSGLFSWTPTEAQGPGVYSVGVAVDDGAGGLTETEFTVEVTEVNSAPRLAMPEFSMIDEGSEWTATLGGTDSDIPAQRLRFALGANVPAGVTLDALTGVLTWTPSETQGAGFYEIPVRVQDDGDPALSATGLVEVEVLDMNFPPSLAPVADRSVVEHEILRFAFLALDLDVPAQTLTYSLESGAQPGMTLSPNSGVFYWSPIENQGPGVYPVTVRVTDGVGGSASQTFTITVQESNWAPRILPLEPRTVKQDETLSLTVAAEDRDEPVQQLSFSLGAAAPVGVSLDAATGRLTWTPGQEQRAGAHEIPVIVTDTGEPAMTARATLIVDVLENNLSPVIAAVTDQSVAEASLLRFSVSASDADVPAQTLSFNLTADAPAGATIDAATGVFSWTPTEAQGPGVYPITVTVADGVGGVAQTDFSIAVTEVNQAPAMTGPGRQTADEGTTLSMRLSAIDTDVPAQNLAYSLAPGSPDGATVDAVTGAFSWTPTEVHGPGTYPVTVIATDDGTPAMRVERTFEVDVREVNQLPEIAPLTERTIEEGALLSFTVEGSDGDVPRQGLVYRLGAGAPQGAMMDHGSGMFRWTPTEAQGPGVYPITLAVEDSAGGHSETTVVVRVTEANSAPTLADMAGRSVKTGETLSFAVRGADPDLPAQSLRYRLGADAPVGAAIDPETGLFNWIPGESVALGTYLIEVVVDDDGTPALSAAKTFLVDVVAGHHRPELDAIANRTVAELEALQVRVSARAAEGTGRTLSYALAPGAPAGAVIHSTSGVLDWTPNESQGPGRYALSVVVTDDAGERVETTFTVDVTETNSAPTLSAPAVSAATEGELFEMVFAASDLDLPNQTLRYALGSPAPAGATMDSITGTLRWTPTETQGPGSHPITVVVTDNGSPAMQATQTVTVTVAERQSRPVLDPVSNATVDEGAVLEVLVSARDTDVPSQTLAFSLGTGAPAGAAIDRDSGLFTWTPSEHDGPGAFPVTVIVADSGGEQAQTGFRVTVKEVNVAPVIEEFSEQTVQAGQWLTVTAVATDSDVPGQHLRFSLGENAPETAYIDPHTGVFRWMPDLFDVGRVHEIDVTVEDGGSPVLNATTTLTVDVTEPDGTGEEPSTYSVVEGNLLRFIVGQDDLGIATAPTSFELAAGAPEGAAIDSANGAFSWTPTEAQGPAVYSITLAALNGAGDRVEWTFTVEVTEENTAPAMGTIANRSVAEGEMLTLEVAAVDGDLPPQQIRYYLESNAPSGAFIESSTGTLQWRPTENHGPGTYAITVVAADDGLPSMRTVRTFAVTVLETNSDPVLAPVEPQSIAEGSRLDIKLSALDPDVPSQTLFFELGSDAPAGMTIGRGTGLLSWMPTEAQGPGSYQVTVRVVDSAGGFATGRIHVDVTEVNSAPVFGALDRHDVREGTLLNFSVTASDSDLPVQQLRFSLGAGAPAGASIDPVTGEFRWTPTEEQGPGTYVIPVVVVDDGTPVRRVERGFLVNVTEFNLAPELAVIADQAVNEEARLQFTVSASDADVPAQELSFRLGTGAPAGAVIDRESGIFSWTPTEAHGPGRFDVTVIVDDGTESRAERRFKIDVAEVNQSPTIDPMPRRSVYEGELVEYRVNAYDPDIPTGQIRYQLGDGAPIDATIDALTGEFRWIPGEDVGPATVRIPVLAEDANGGVGLFIATVQVRELNMAPRLIVPARLNAREGTTLRFTAAATDTDQPKQRVRFRFGVNVPSGASIDPDSGEFRWTPTETQGPGQYQISIIAEDDGSPSMRTETTLSVDVSESNQSPTLSPIADRSVNEGMLARVILSATDPDLPANQLRFQFVGTAPEGATLDPVRGVFAWTPTEAQGPGVFPVVVAVDDGQGGTDQQSFLVTVNEVNTAPVLAPIANQTAREGEQLVFRIRAEDVDAPAQRLTYRFGNARPQGATLDPVNGELRWTPGEHDGGNSVGVTVVVEDDGSPALRAERTFSIAVQETNSAPSIEPIPPVSVAEGATLQLLVDADDADVPVQPIRFQLADDAPAGAVIDPVQGLIQWTPTEEQGPGRFVLTVTVQDNADPVGSAVRRIEVDVTETNEAPVLGDLKPVFVDAGSRLTLVADATDADVPDQALAFRLGEDSPAGMTIDRLTGAVSWQVPAQTPAGTHEISIVVSDNGTPALSDETTVTVTVRNDEPIEPKTPDDPNLDNIEFGFDGMQVRSDRVVELRFRGAPGVAYRIDASEDMRAWVPLETVVAGDTAVTVTDSDAPNFRKRFYRAVQVDGVDFTPDGAN